MNTNAAFDFAGELIAAKTLSEMVELSSTHARKQFEALTQQSKELSALAQKVATETAEPIKSGVSKALSQGRLTRARRRIAFSNVIARWVKPGLAPGFCLSDDRRGGHRQATAPLLQGRNPCQS